MTESFSEINWREVGNEEVANGMMPVVDEEKEQLMLESKALVFKYLLYIVAEGDPMKIQPEDDEQPPSSR